jgi:hypothetical protein
VGKRNISVNLAKGLSTKINYKEKAAICQVNNSGNGALWHSSLSRLADLV